MFIESVVGKLLGSSFRSEIPRLSNPLIKELIDLVSNLEL